MKTTYTIYNTENDVLGEGFKGKVDIAAWFGARRGCTTKDVKVTKMNNGSEMYIELHGRIYWARRIRK